MVRLRGPAAVKQTQQYNTRNASAHLALLALLGRQLALRGVARLAQRQLDLRWLSKSTRRQFEQKKQGGMSRSPQIPILTAPACASPHRTPPPHLDPAGHQLCRGEHGHKAELAHHRAAEGRGRGGDEGWGEAGSGMGCSEGRRDAVAGQAVARLPSCGLPLSRRSVCPAGDAPNHDACPASRRTC